VRYDVHVRCDMMSVRCGKLSVRCDRMSVERDEMSIGLDKTSEVCGPTRLAKAGCSHPLSRV